jgi:hypothetical protein
MVPNPYSGDDGARPAGHRGPGLASSYISIELRIEGRRRGFSVDRGNTPTGQAAHADASGSGWTRRPVDALSNSETR